MFKNVIRKTTLALNNHTITSGILRPFCYFPFLLSAISKPRLDLVHKTLMVFVNATLQWRKLC